MDPKDRETESFIRTTIKGGILFLLPIGVVVLIVGKTFQFVRNLAEPVIEPLGVERLIGILVLEFVALIAIIAFCFVAGMLANLPRIRIKASALEKILIDNVPVYSFVDGLTKSFARADDQAENLLPVLAFFDDNAQLGFEIERTVGGIVVVYLPGSPSTWSGTTVFMRPDRVERIDIKTHEVIKTLSVLGRGSGRIAERLDLRDRIDLHGFSPRPPTR